MIHTKHTHTTITISFISTCTLVCREDSQHRTCQHTTPTAAFEDTKTMEKEDGDGEGRAQ